MKLQTKVAAPKDAAAVILLNKDFTQVLWAQRNPELKFLGGWHAFPGGKLEASDAEIKVENCADAERAKFIVCAVRETFEEVGFSVFFKLFAGNFERLNGKVERDCFYEAGFQPKKTIALDLSIKSLEVAREQFEKDGKTDAENICAVQGNVLKLPFADETFDLILTCGVLEYVSLEEGLKEFARVLKTGAKLIMIPVKPSFVGSVLEILYNFKTHSLEETKKIAARYFEVVGDYNFPITEPIGWSKMIFLLEKKRIG